jgi:hypothetical protein
MAWTSADRDALKAAMAQGERRVQFADRSVEYRSIDEMAQVLALMDTELDAAAGTPRPKSYLGYATGGW